MLQTTISLGRESNCGLWEVLWKMCNIEQSADTTFVHAEERKSRPQNKRKLVLCERT